MIKQSFSPITSQSVTLLWAKLVKISWWRKHCLVCQELSSLNWYLQCNRGCITIFRTDPSVRGTHHLASRDGKKPIDPIHPRTQSQWCVLNHWKTSWSTTTTLVGWSVKTQHHPTKTQAIYLFNQVCLELIQINFWWSQKGVNGKLLDFHEVKVPKTQSAP